MTQRGYKRGYKKGYKGATTILQRGRKGATRGAIKRATKGLQRGHKRGYKGDTKGLQSFKSGPSDVGDVRRHNPLESSVGKPRLLSVNCTLFWEVLQL